jgi:ABC-type transport system substrate-binding protein
MVGRLIHRGLLTRNQGSIVGDLAGTYEVRDLTYTFYIDPEAVFHSGKPVEAADVAYSLEKLARASRLTAASSFVLAIRGAREFRHSAVSEIAGVFLIDKKTVSITLNNPFPAFEDYLAGPGGYIVPKPGITTTGGNTIGAGPYKIKRRDLNSLTLVPVDKDAGEVFLDSLNFTRFNNTEEAALSMELGRLDIIPVLGESLPKFISASSYTSLTGKTLCSVVLGFNGEREYQKESFFSRAVSFLIDRESIIRVILGGSAALPEGPVPGFEDAPILYDFFLIPDSVSYYLSRIKNPPENITLYVDSRYPVLSKVSRYVAGQLGGRGINVSEKKVDFSYLEETRVKSELDMYLSYYDPVSDNPDCILYPLFNYGLAGHSNYLFYNDRPFQSFLGNLRIETDPERRQMLSYGLIQSLANEPPAITLYEPYLIIIAKPDISGLKNTEEGYIDLRGAFIEND